MTTASQLRRAIESLGMTHGALAKLVGADIRTGLRWVRGERAVPPTLAILVQLLVVGKITVADVEAALKRTR